MFQLYNNYIILITINDNDSSEILLNVQFVIDDNDKEDRKKK